MYLKKLSLKGFKSFPIKTEIFFEQGITAIVGPNGSGKSNISDAIRWVLGEQSIKSLRGEKMEDVIFSGTDSKKQLNYCEVSLTLDNTLGEIDLDSDEMIVKRRAYRTGESEYFINGKACRLRDVKETLMDTGIGKDGYSIIEQGKVEEILSNNPVNRRKVFDEACGIAKYRYRKNEAEKNLKKSSENLSRIVDIFTEIEKQIGPLEKQQEKAKKYLKISEELKKFEVNDIIKQNEDYENAINDLVFQTSEVTKEIEVLEKEKVELEKEISELEKDINSIEIYTDKLNSEMMELNNLINSNKTDAEITAEKIKNNKQEIDRKKEETEILKKKLLLANREFKKANDKTNENSYIIEEYEKQLGNSFENKRNTELKLNEINKEIDENKEKSVEILKNREDISNSITKLTANIENMMTKKSEIEGNISSIKNSIIKLENEISDKKQKEEKLIEEIDKEEKKVISFNEKIERINTDAARFNENYQKHNMQIGSLNAKRNTYMDMENHHEGFNRGVREILKNKNIEGIHGAFGELIKVPQKYEKAIEASLGAAIQNVVVENENIAKESISYLKKNNLGRVTFLPMNIIKATRFDVKTMKSTVKAIGIASELVNFDNRYKNIVDNLLGRVVVIENIDQAILFAKDTQHRYKIVTLEGEILNPGGSMTGGSLKSSGNILSRKRIIDELAEEINQKTVILKDMLISIEDLKTAKQNTKIDREKSFNNKAQLEKERITINTELKMLVESLEKSKKSLSKSKSLIENTDEEIAKSKQVCDLHKEKLKELETKEGEKESNLELLLEKKLKIKGEYEEAVRTYNDKNLELTRLKASFENELTELERISSEIEDGNKKIEDISKTIEENKKELEILAELEEKYKLEIEENSKKYSLLEEKMKEKKESKEVIKEKFEEKKSILRNKDRKLLESNEEKFKLDSKLERNKNSRDNLLSNLFEKYELTYVQALEFKDTTISIDRKRIEKLKRAIKELGNVNIDSIDEYEEVKERHDYYKEQKEDLEQSIISLNELIDDLVSNMEKEFVEKFKVINQNFKKVYQKLFGGGNAELRLTDMKNVLACDIDITAQPPGKKMKNLSLLSGGEKALTAICILFAILISKPTPFCILDEIEAPLDDVNVYRFGEYLRELSKDTQFIAVTHRRGTMEVADYIYGVTMQEKGVSSVISLKLKEATEIIEK